MEALDQYCLWAQVGSDTGKGSFHCLLGPASSSVTGRHWLGLR